MKEKIIWTQEYSVNVAEFDEQHKEFINICNGLIELTEKEEFTKEEALSGVMKLGDYASYHLGSEEALFTKINYPDAAMHVEIHDQFREKAKGFIEKIRDENVDIAKTLKEVAEFSISWFLSHILEVDKKYSDYFNKHGIS